MPGEFELIARIRSRAKRDSAAVTLGIGDDAAVLKLQENSELVCTSDLSVEGVHFRLNWTTPALVGQKTMTVSLSDLAAMGATPLAALVSIAAPKRSAAELIDRFYDGVLSVAEEYGFPVVGGDISSIDGPVVIDTILLGEVEEGTALRRSGAKAGDMVWVSGVLGSSVAGYRALQLGLRLATASGSDGDAVEAHLRPVARLKLGSALRTRKLATAAIDVSDGLSSDLGHICEESGLGAIIDAALLPKFGSLNDALHGGEQYELLFASPAERRPEVEALALELGIALTCIGKFEGEGVTIINKGDSQPLVPHGWDHFQS